MSDSDWSGYSRKEDEVVNPWICHRVFLQNWSITWTILSCVLVANCENWTRSGIVKKNWSIIDRTNHVLIARVHRGSLTEKAKFQATSSRSLRTRTSRAGARGARTAASDSTPPTTSSSSSAPSLARWLTSVASEAVATYTECERGFQQPFRGMWEWKRIRKGHQLARHWGFVLCIYKAGLPICCKILQSMSCELNCRYCNYLLPSKPSQFGQERITYSRDEEAVPLCRNSLRWIPNVIVPSHHPIPKAPLIAFKSMTERR